VALHLLLFSSDQRTASELGQTLAGYDIEVELCSEILTAVEELTTRKFDAIISDWEEGAEGNFLIRTARELKCTRDCVTIGLVSDAGASSEAVQSGAHAVIHRPLVAAEIHDAVKSLREFVESRNSEGLATKTESSTPSGARAVNEIKKPLSPPPSPADFRAIAEANKPRPVPATPPRKTWSELQALRPAPPAEPKAGTVFGGTSPEEESTFDRPSRKIVRLALWSAMLLGCACIYTWAPQTSYSERVASVVLSAVDEATKTPEPEQIRPSEEDFAVKGNPVLTRHLLRSLAPVPPQASQNLPKEWIEESDQNGEVVVPPMGYEQSVASASGATAPSKLQPATTASNGQLPESLKAPVLTASGRLGGVAPPNGLPNLLQPVVLTEELARKLLVSHTAPLYPEQALRSGIQGAVVLEAFIGKDGSISDLKLVRGPLLLGHAAFDAVKQWRFQPYVFNGQPTDAETLITISFRLPSIGQNLQKISSVPLATPIEAR